MMRMYIIIVLVAVVLGAGFFVTRSLVDTGRQEVKIETLETNIEIRRLIDEAIRNGPDGRDESIGVLEQFLDTRD